MGLAIPFGDDIAPLLRPVAVGRLEAPNALAVHPMEGCDANADGSPGPLTLRRYERYARGGAGLIWVEATAVVPEGKGNPRQLLLDEANVESFANLAARVRRARAEEYGGGSRPLLVLQLTHSGRYSRPEGSRKPVIAAHNPLLDPAFNLSPDYPVIADEELDALADRFVAAARLAREAGFDAVDIKACHGYLVAELLSAHTREGRYGGSFANCTRFLLEVVERVRAAVPDLLLAVRLGVCDGMPYPYSWGMDAAVPGKVDLAEPLRLVRLLVERGVRLISVTAGNPYRFSYYTRPSDRETRGAPTPPEHPLEGVARLLALSRAVQEAAPEVVVVSAGFSWLRQHFPWVAAGAIGAGWLRMAGVGRLAFAYPGFTRDLRERGALDVRKVCTTCSKCSQLLREGGFAGCVTRDAATYVPFYKEYCRPA